MPEDTEIPDQNTDYQIHEPDDAKELRRLKPEEKEFVSCVFAAIQKAREAGSPSQIHPDVIRAIGISNLRFAYELVMRESISRPDELAALANVALTHPEEGIDAGELISELRSLAISLCATSENSIVYLSDDHKSLIRAAVVIRDTFPDVSVEILTLLKDKLKEYRGTNKSQYLQNQAAMRSLVEATALIDPVEAEYLLFVYEIQNDFGSDRPIETIVLRYLDLGDYDSALRVALQFARLNDIIAVGSELAKTNPDTFLDALKRKWPIIKDNDNTSRLHDFLVVISGVVHNLMESGEYSDNAQRLVQAGRDRLDKANDPQIYFDSSYFYANKLITDALRKFIPVIAYFDMDDALDMVELTWDKRSEYYKSTRREVSYEIAAAVSFHNIDRALLYYLRLTKQHAGISGGAKALVTLALQCARHHKDGNANMFLEKLGSHSRNVHFVSNLSIGFKELAQLSDVFPEFALEKLKSMDPTFLGGSAYTENEKMSTVFRYVLYILEKSGASNNDRQEVLNMFLEYLPPHEAHAAAVAYLQYLQPEAMCSQYPEMLSLDGILSYFYSLDPNSDADIHALERFVDIDIVQFFNTDESWLVDDPPHPGAMMLLCLGAKETVLTTHHDVSKSRLFDFAQSSDETIRKQAIHCLKLLKNEYIALFYSGKADAFSFLEEVSAATPEMEEWFVLLDEHIASNFNQFELPNLIEHISSERVAQLFPITVDHAIAALHSELTTNVELGIHLIKKLNNCYKSSWVSLALELACVHDHQVSQVFLHELHSGDIEWREAPFVPRIVEIAKACIEESKKAQDVYDDDIPKDGFAAKDTFEKHAWRMTGEKMALAHKIERVMAGTATQDEIDQLKLSEEALHALEFAERYLTDEYDAFMAQFVELESVPEEDKIAILAPDRSPVRMPDLKDSIRGLFAQYMVQMTERFVYLSEVIVNLISEPNSEIRDLLHHGFLAFKSFYTTDMPLYDLLYDDFDDVRKSGRHPLEVYLGRDGIYAYLGRRVQDIARRRKLGAERRRKLMEAGDIVRIRPKYIVYPRVFRTRINEEALQQFLAQEGIDRSADPVFFDTGYVGSIPEHIMTIMGFDPAEIESRIRLLSAKVAHRQVRGIQERQGEGAVGIIENRSKPEKTAVRLYRDETTGKIRHIAEPASPFDQFCFMMTRQAIIRHYWLKESMHFRHSGSISVDTDTHTMRIRQEYAHALPADFIRDPQKYIEEHDKKTKEALAEHDDAPDVSVIATLKDGTEIIARKIRRGDEEAESKGFAVIVGARRSDLPTVEPVAFLLGKTKTTESYVAVARPHAYSRRTLEKYLRSMGYSDNRIDKTMHRIACLIAELEAEYRATLGISDEWHIGDVLIRYNSNNQQILSIIPSEWRRESSDTSDNSSQHTTPTHPEESPENIAA